MRIPGILVGVVIVALMSQMSFAQTSPYGHWTKFKIPQKDCFIQNLVFADSEVGYCTVRVNKVLRRKPVYTDPFQYGSIWDITYRTSDGGTTWNPIILGPLFRFQADSADTPGFGLSIIPYPASHDVAYAQVIINDSDVIVHQNFTDAKQLLIRTTDAGKTWDSVHTVIGITDLWNILTFFDVNNGLSIRMDDGLFYLYSTPNGGKAWFKVDTVRASHFSFNDQQHFFRIDTAWFDSSLTTFQSVDGGKKWVKNSWLFPEDWKSAKFDHPVQISHLQSVKNTSSVFLLGGNITEHLDGAIGQLSDSVFAFLYSTDYGKTFNANHSFAERVRSFEATAPNDIWMTVLPEALRKKYYIDVDGKISYFAVNAAGTQIRHDTMIAARWIVHSIDTGKTWHIDDTTLIFPESDVYDGFITTSSDPRHIWIGARGYSQAYIFTYHAPSISSVEDDGTPKPNPAPTEYKQWFNMYPNPADRKMTVALWRGDPIDDIKVCDILGRNFDVPVKRIRSNEVELDVSNLKYGHYIVTFKDKYAPHAKSFLVVHK